MSKHRIWLHSAATALVCAALGAAAPAAQADDTQHTVIPADQIEWKPGPPVLYGVEATVLSGKPGEEGPFIMRLKFPAGFDYPVHRHPGTQGHITVLSGAIGLGFGETFERDAAPLLPAGSYFVMPDEWHYAWTADETVVQVHGNGPWRVQFRDPPKTQ